MSEGMLKPRGPILFDLGFMAAGVIPVIKIPIEISLQIEINLPND